MPSVVRCGAFYVSTEVRGLLTAEGFFLFTPKNLVVSVLTVQQLVHVLLALVPVRFKFPEFLPMFLGVGTVGK